MATGKGRGASAGPVSEGRALLQERLTLFAKTAFLLSSGFFAFATATAAAYPGALPWLNSGGAPFDIAGNLVLLATWMASRHGIHPNRRLRVLEASSIFLYCAALAAPVAFSRALDPGGKYTMLLAFTSVVIGRSVLVPSTPAWTVGLSTACVVPLVAASWMFDHAGSRGTTTVGGTLSTVWTLLWCVDAVVVSVVTSYVIYGLRERVRQAMRLGQYTLGPRIGTGGMGEVYKASHALLKRPAAVKLLPPEKIGEAALRRFEREVQLTSKLTHPNTIAVFDYGHTASGIFYYVMEYLDGIDLQRLVRAHGAQSPARVVHVLGQVCGALQEAHDMGLVHRDVKPANVMLCRRGGMVDVAKVVDFGLAKDLQAPESTELTGENAIAGTPLYLSPEAIAGATSVGPESDLYGLGAVGYFLVTGRPPFEGNLIQVCSQHLHAAPAAPSERLGRRVPRQLEALLLRCLEKDPKRRPSSASELAAALAACSDVGEWTGHAARAWWREHGSDAIAGVEEEPTFTGSLAVSVD